MWVEANIMISGIAAIFIAVVLSQIILWNMMLGVLLFFSIGMIIFSLLLISYQIKHNHLDVLMDPLPASQELCVLVDFAGNIDFQRTRKAPLGKREFVKYHKEASIINKGDFPIRCINGNHGFFGHESYDQNVNLLKAEALDKLEGDDIKEIVSNLDMVRKEVDNLA